jgi:hypothetical protein
MVIEKRRNICVYKNEWIQYCNSEEKVESGVENLQEKKFLSGLKLKKKK